MSLDWKNLAPYDRVTFRGKQMNARDAAMHLVAERKFGATVGITQGAFTGGVSASAGTHTGGGCLDWSLYGMSDKQIRRWMRATKDTGWCSWWRKYVPGLWPEHAHGVARGCKNLADVAERQIPAFDALRDGLVSNAPDLTYRPDPKVTFDYPAWKQRELARGRLRRVNDRIGDWRRQIKGLRRKIITAKREKERIRRGAGLS